MIIKSSVLLIVLSLYLTSCCAFIKAKELGNNFILSEYDANDIQILYSKDKCSGSGIPIVPRTVLKHAHDAKWIVAKSSGAGVQGEYYIIDKGFEVEIIADNDSTFNVVKSHVFGPMDSVVFEKNLKAKGINLHLK